MTGPQILILMLLGATLILFIWGKYRHDIVALASLFSAALLGLVEINSIFVGFGHPATITVALILICSFGLAKAGVTQVLANLISPLSRWPLVQNACLITIGAFLSAFMNNVGVLALLMPVAIQLAQKSQYSASLILMPLSFGTLLGGMTTMIGTPPNIVMAAYREKAMGEPFAMFDFTPVGLIVAVAGIIYLALIGWRFLGQRRVVQDETEEMFQLRNYITEVTIGSKSKIMGATIGDLEESAKDLDFLLVGLVRDGKKFNILNKNDVLQIDDILLIEADPKDTELFVMRNQVEIGHKDPDEPIFNKAHDDWVEAVVSPQSMMEGRTVDQLKLTQRYGVKLLAVSRQGNPFRGRLKFFRFQVGDVLLLRGEVEMLREFLNLTRLLPLVQRGLELGKQIQPLESMLIFGAAVAVTAMGILPYHMTFGFAVMAMVVRGIIPIKQLYDGVDWSVIVLLACLIPIGQAFETTGASSVIAGQFMKLTHITDPTFCLVFLLIFTMALTDVLNNVATVVLMAPIAKQIADGLSANPDPFFMTVAVGASCAFLTPIGHQNNALIMGPGRYKFSDYWRVGLPLDIVIVAIAVPAILWTWPL